MELKHSSMKKEIRTYCFSSNMFHKDETDDYHLKIINIFKNTTIQVFPENQHVSDFQSTCTHRKRILLDCAIEL